MTPVVLDLGFGDSGKGATVDWLVRALGAGLVVRWNGGAQAGHRVVTADGREHVFSQVGAGTFAGARSLLADGFVLHPGALVMEARALARVGVADALAGLAIDERARLITPFAQAAGRLRELARRERRHGSCGVGFGETVADFEARADDTLRAGDLGDRKKLRASLARQQERKRAELAELRALRGDARVDAELAVLEDRNVIERCLELWSALDARALVVDETQSASLVRDTEHLVLEGAQGILLDEAHGFHPHTTWSDCTPRGALALLGERAGEARVLGITRAYATRHGEGPFPAHDPAWSALLPDARNGADGWQGAFRVGPLDLVTLRHAAGCAGRLDGVVITCIDRLREVPAPEVVDGHVDEDGRVHEAIALDASDREAVTRRLARSRARRRKLESDAALVPLVEENLGAPIVLTSEGPSAADRSARAWLAQRRRA